MANKGSKKQATGEDLIRFTAPNGGAPATLVAEVEIPMTHGPLAGLRLGGIQIWRKKDDATHLFVTFPGRRYDTDEGVRTYEYLRPANGQGETAKAVRQHILAAYQEHLKRQAEEPAAR